MGRGREREKEREKGERKQRNVKFVIILMYLAKDFHPQRHLTSKTALQLILMLAIGYMNRIT